jgi:hypothetical protein
LRAIWAVSVRLKERFNLKDFLVWKALVKALPSPNALFDHNWAIWRVKDALRGPQKTRIGRLFFFEKQSLTRQIARPQLPMWFV